MLTPGCLHPCSLVRAVDRRRALCHYDPFLVRSVRIVCPEDNLPSGRHSACRREDVVSAVPFIEFCSFDGRLCLVAVVDNPARRKKRTSVRSHRSDEQNAFQSGTTSGASVGEVGLAVLIPERTRVYIALSLDDPYRIAPLSSRVGRRDHEYPAVRISAINVELSVVVSYGRRPYAVAVLWYGSPYFILSP